MLSLLKTTVPDRRRTEVWLLVLVVVFSGVMIAASLVFMRMQAVAAAFKLNESLAHLVAEQTARTFQALDERLELISLQMRLLAGEGPLQHQRIQAMFEQQLQHLPSADRISYFDLAGARLYSHGKPGTSSADNRMEAGDANYTAARALADIQTFKAQPHTTFLMGAPHHAVGSQAWQFPAVRPVFSSSGELTGVLAVAIDLKAINEVWDEVDYGGDGSVALFKRDGTLLMRSPFRDAMVGKNYQSRPLFQRLVPAGPAGNYRDFSGIDGVERLFSYRVLDDYPDHVIVVGQSIAQILKSWLEWTKLAVALWLIAFGAVFVLRTKLNQIRRQTIQAQKDLAESENRYHALFVGSVDAILLTSPDGQILSVNPATCRMFDHTEAEILALGRAGLVDTSDPRLPAALAERTHTGRFQGELSFVRKGGEKFVGEVFASVFKSADGQDMSTMIIRDVTDRKQAEAKLSENAEKLQILSRSIISAQETERRRIAAELHDELGQSLTAIKINLLARSKNDAEPSAARNLESVRIVDDALQQVRRLAMALRPSILDNLGLVPALHAIGKQTAALAGLELSFSAVTLEKRLPSELETTCFRIVQECLTNIVRHASASHIAITVQVQAEHLVIAVQDDGVGFDWSRAQSGVVFGESLGVLGMHERAHLVGGELTIDTAPDQGCTVRLRCPLNLTKAVP